MYLLFPGRHHILIDFQFKYLFKLIHSGLKNAKDVNDQCIGTDEPIKAIIFAVTMVSQHQNGKNK